MSQNDVAQAGRFTNKSAGHYNRLSLRNGVSLNGLTRNPLDLEIFFQAALFFISQAGKDDFLDQETFLARLEFFRSHHAAWLAGTTEENDEWMQGCGLVVLTDDGKDVWDASNWTVESIAVEDGALTAHLMHDSGSGVADAVSGALENGATETAGGVLDAAGEAVKSAGETAAEKATDFIGSLF